MAAHNFVSAVYSLIYAANYDLTVEERHMFNFFKRRAKANLEDIVNAMAFEGNDANTREEKAYLFNVANTDEAVAAAEAAFAFTSITPGTVPSIPAATTENYNGTVTVKGCATVNGTYVAPATTEHQFYKAELLLPAADPVAN